MGIASDSQNLIHINKVKYLLRHVGLGMHPACKKLQQFLTLSPPYSDPTWPELILKRRLTTANRSCVSIRGQSCKNFPHILIDHHPKFGCQFSYCVHACRRGCGWALGNMLPMCYINKFRRFRSNRLGIGRGHKNLGDTGALPPWDGSWLILCRHASPTRVIISNFLALGQTVWNR